MNSHSAKEQDDDLDDNDTQETVVLDDGSTDNVGDASVEINVEALISELEADGLTEACAAEHAAAKRRLEDLMEQKRSKQQFEDFDDYDV